MVKIIRNVIGILLVAAGLAFYLSPTVATVKLESRTQEYIKTFKKETKASKKTGKKNKKKNKKKRQQVSGDPFL